MLQKFASARQSVLICPEIPHVGLCAGCIVASTAGRIAAEDALFSLALVRLVFLDLWMDWRVVAFLSSKPILGSTVSLLVAPADDVLWSDKLLLCTMICSTAHCHV